MTDELRKATEGLYETFSIYPFKSTMDGCPCCVSNSDKEKIHSKQLRELDGDDLSRYAFKAMTTWGNTEDFKHYLPRIFELIATTDFIVDTFVVLGKLEYGKWRTWETNEQNAIEAFLFAWWIDQTRNKPYFDKEPFFEIVRLTDDIDRLLELWKISFEDQSFIKYVDLVYNYYNDLINKKGDFKKLTEASRSTFVNWIRTNSEKLENGFFYYESRDKELAGKISTTVYIFERTV
jgi:hypothetical protein